MFIQSPPALPDTNLTGIGRTSCKKMSRSEAVLLTAVEERVILLVSYFFDLPCRRHTISPKINSL